MARKGSLSGGTLFAEARPLKFDEKLVLNQRVLGLLDKKKFEQLAGPLKASELEGLDENNVHRFLHQMKLLWEFPDFPGDTLLGYDQNIVGHTLRLCEKRDQPIRWKYFQWLSLLFTEVYLDRFFGDPERLVEQPGDVQRTLLLFEESNRLYAALQ